MFLCIMIMLIMLLTGCGRKVENINISTPTKEHNSVTQSSENIKMEENQPLTIYHISDDEIELHFSSDKLTSIANLVFLVPSADGNGSYNPSVSINLEYNGDEISPRLTVYNTTMEVEYIIDLYCGEMEASITDKSLICHIKHENIIEPFEKTELWHIDTESPQTFDGIIKEDVAGVMEPVVEGVLPDEFKRSEYDNQYFKPNSDDFVVITYEQPIVLYVPVWYKNRTGVYEYGPYRDDNTKQSSAIVTYILSFDGDSCTSTKIRIEYKSIEDAMYAGLIRDFTICPVALGYENEPNDDLITEGYFEEAELMLYERLAEKETDTLDVTYQGHYDNYRYFDFTRREEKLKYIDDVSVCENNGTLAYQPFISLDLSAGEAITQSIMNYNENYELKIYSSKKTFEAGSNSVVLESIQELHGDGQYFTPLTDDYVYVIRNNLSDTGYYIEELYSFDNYGKLVQDIMRERNPYFEQEGFDYKSYKSDLTEEQLAHVIFDDTDKVFYIDELALWGGENLLYEGMNANDTQKDILLQELINKGEHGGYYFSKP